MEGEEQFHLQALEWVILPGRTNLLAGMKPK